MNALVSILEIRGLAVAVGGRIVVSDVSLDIAENEVFGILGGSGSGKTTLLRSIVGLISPRSGSIKLWGEDAINIEPANRGISFMHQSLALFEDLTVESNISFAGKQTKRNRRVNHRQTYAHDGVYISSLTRDLGLDQYKNVLVSQLSGGERQRVALARALSAGRKLLLLDEPLSQLDLALRGRSRTLMRRLFEQYQYTVLLVSHDINDCIDLCDRIGILSGGRLVETGTPGQLIRFPRFLETAVVTGPMNLLKLDGSLSIQGHECTTRLSSGLELHAIIQDEPVAVSEYIFWGIRPFSIDLRFRDGWFLLCEGLVVRSVDTGRGSLILVEIASGEILRVEVEDIGVKVYSKVSLYYDPNDARLLRLGGDSYD